MCYYFHATTRILRILYSSLLHEPRLSFPMLFLLLTSSYFFFRFCESVCYFPKWNNTHNWQTKRGRRSLGEEKCKTRATSLWWREKIHKDIGSSTLRKINEAKGKLIGNESRDRKAAICKEEIRRDNGIKGLERGRAMENIAEGIKRNGRQYNNKLTDCKSMQISGKEGSCYCLEGKRGWTKKEEKHTSHYSHYSSTTMSRCHILAYNNEERRN